MTTRSVVSYMYRKEIASMGKKGRRKRNQPKRKAQKLNSTNFVPEAGPGCYIARRDLSPDWVIEWEDVDPLEFEEDEVASIAIDPEEKTLSLCNVEDFYQIAYITVYDMRIWDSNFNEMKQGSTTDNDGNTRKCITFIVLCPPCVFVHLAYIDDFTTIEIDSDVRQWSRHPNPDDEHYQRIGFPLEGGPFLCTQGENGTLTHFFSGNLHAIDFACRVGTPLLAVADGTVIEAKDSNTLTGIATSNLFHWNSILIKVDADQERETLEDLFVEYVHIEKSLVKAGDRITKGQVIGSSGSVGFSPEPHLHFSAFRSSDPRAPTVRVKFQSYESENEHFLPRAGYWYDSKGVATKPM